MGGWGPRACRGTRAAAVDSSHGATSQSRSSYSRQARCGIVPAAISSPSSRKRSELALGIRAGRVREQLPGVRVETRRLGSDRIRAGKLPRACVEVDRRDCHSTPGAFAGFAEVESWMLNDHEIARFPPGHVAVAVLVEPASNPLSPETNWSPSVDVGPAGPVGPAGTCRPLQALQAAGTAKGRLDLARCLAAELQARSTRFPP